MKLTVLDLFCGCGGMTQGLEMAGLEVLAGVDIWDKAVDNYNKNHSHQAFCEDLTKFPPEKMAERVKVPIDIIVGWPPCQGFSIAGRRDTKDPRNSLFMEYVRYINYFRPKAFIMENVMGILSMKTAKGESVIDIITSHFDENYNWIVCKLFASDFGVPQNRRRVIIIGVRKDLGIVPSEPKPTSPRPPVGPLLLPRDQVPEAYFLSERAKQGIETKKERSKKEGNGFGAQILDVTKPSYTIPARYWKDGYDALVRYPEDGHLRRLTILELKRIQSFPDDYVLDGSKKDVIMQIGNAVACLFAEQLGHHLIRTLQQ